MKNIKHLVLLVSLCGLLSSCANNVPIRYDVKDYKSFLSMEDDFLICQLSDLHFSTSTDLNREFEYITNLINSYAEINDNERNPDLLILDGDLFMNSNRKIVQKTFSFFDELGIPYAFTYGNHDYHGFYSYEYINNVLAKSKHSLLKNPTNDDVYGNSNYVIDIKKGDETKFQVYVMDSNSYAFGDYDNIHQDQVDWYERCLLDSAGLTELPETIDENTFPIKNLTFFHIPTFEFKNEVARFKAQHPNEIQSETERCYAPQRCNTEGVESNIMDKMHQLKATVGVGCGHDHRNSIDLTSYDNSDWPIRLVYGNKSGDNCAFDINTMGATFYRVFDEPIDGQYFELSKILFNYEYEAKLEWKR